MKVAADVVLFRMEHNRVWVLLIERGNPPFKGSWALPGGFIEEDESPEAAACRELKEETGINFEELIQLRAYGAPGRDPRGRTISIAYYGILQGDQNVKAGDDAANASWFNILELPPLAFDHRVIIDDAVRDLSSRTEVFGH